MELKNKRSSQLVSSDQTVSSLVETLLKEKDEDLDDGLSNKREFGTQVDGTLSDIQHMEDIYRGLKDDLDVTYEMLHLNEKHQVKSRLMDTYGLILEKLRIMNVSAQQSLGNERLQQRLEKESHVKQLKAQHEVSYFSF